MEFDLKSVERDDQLGYADAAITSLSRHVHLVPKARMSDILRIIVLMFILPEDRFRVMSEKVLELPLANHLTTR
jgi:hypothetical protein